MWNGQNHRNIELSLVGYGSQARRTSRLTFKMNMFAEGFVLNSFDEMSDAEEELIRDYR